MTDIRTQAVVWTAALSTIGFVLLCPPFSLLWRVLGWLATGHF